MLRSVRNAFEYIHRDDPDSAITVHTIRTWCKEGKVRYLMAGTRVLVDMDSLLDFINVKKEK